MSFINEITDYFTDKEIKELDDKDQLLYYKLISIFNGYEVSINDDEIKKINCVAIFYDYKYKSQLRAIDIIVAGDYPLALLKILSTNCYQDYDNKLIILAKEYNRFLCIEILEALKEKINEMNNLMGIDDSVSIIKTFLYYEN